MQEHPSNEHLAPQMEPKKQKGFHGLPLQRQLMLAEAPVRKCKGDGIGEVRGVLGRLLRVFTWLGLSLSCLASQPL